VNGEIEATFGLHTRFDPEAWLRIDLGEVRPIGKVVVYNRGDGYFDDVLPLALELSDDSKRWREVALRRTRFTQDDPWKHDLAGERARFVRLRRKEPGHLWLSEVEIYPP
jgi:hypothetical protein